MPNGHVIKNTCIAVDYWTTGKLLYFLTHCHADHMAKLTHHWWLPIYTSHTNARWLEEVIKISKHFLRPLNINEEVIIENPYSKDKFTVTLIDARHCPGAVMFYFQGTFGNILYTGDFRYDDQMHTDLILQSIIRKQDVNVLYLDNTYASPTCDFPSREEVMEEILDIIMKHPNSHVYLGLRLLGKEDILWNIYKKLKEKVYVNEKRMRLLKTLKLQTDMCTSKQSESRISVVHFSMLTSAWIEDRRREGIDCLGIKPTALFTYLNSAKTNSSSSGLYVVPYSDHCSSKELSSFVSDLKPQQLYPIINNTKHIGSELNKRMCKIPDSFYALCRKENVSNHLCEKYQKCSCDEHAFMVNCSKSVPQKYSKNSKYRTCEILNRGLEKISHPSFHSHNCTTESLHLNTVQNSLSNKKVKPIINSKLTACKMSGNKVNTRLNRTELSGNKVNTRLNRTESCKHHRFSLLYLNDAEEIFIEQKQEGDHSRENLEFKTNRSNYEAACNTQSLKCETEKRIQKLRHENSFLDSDIIFHGIKFNAQTKVPYTQNDSNSAINISGTCIAEPLKKKIKISKKLDL